MNDHLSVKFGKAIWEEMCEAEYEATQKSSWKSKWK